MAPKKKKAVKNDITLNDFANAEKPVKRSKKVNKIDEEEVLLWESIDDDDLDIAQEFNEDGTKVISVKKIKQKLVNVDDIPLDQRPGIVYPEILWYLISLYIHPEDVAVFACINRTTYTLTKKGKFWQNLYNQHCKDCKNLPQKLRIEMSFRFYGLKQRVVRALYHSYDRFTLRITRQSEIECKPHTLVKQKCVSVWYQKSTHFWLFFFKFKKGFTKRTENINLVKLLENVDANPEENSQVLQVTCQQFFEIPPIMGMTLCSVGVYLAQGFRHHRLHLGFTSTFHSITRTTVPEKYITLDFVMNIALFDWWHPRYPYTEAVLPYNNNQGEDEPRPVLEKDFLSLAL